MFFTKRCPSGGTEYVSFEVNFWAFLVAPGRGEGAPLHGTVPLQNPEVTSRKACLRNAEAPTPGDRKKKPKNAPTMFGVFRGVFVKFVKARSLQCRFWPRSSQIPIWILPWLFGLIFLSSCFFVQGKGPEKSTKNSPAKFTWHFVRRKFPSHFCRSLFRRVFEGVHRGISHLVCWEVVLLGEGPLAEPRHEVFPEISPVLLCSVMGISH